ncbi:hypothetical protein B0T16DRAFT_422714 [Cercophora newfieldiana]|uniref:Uncharacterized protein n=1 Tax=Cercophora newfieldiana TaxID=92897 RepID=A0AA39XS55_9PEZI|nr:hypothetical protein B0T16DRAFT_422714 [Cercophora newfieldiana]
MLRNKVFDETNAGSAGDDNQGRLTRSRDATPHRTAVGQSLRLIGIEHHGPSLDGQLPFPNTTPGIRWSSPTQLLIRPSLVYRWESGRDPEFSSGYGRMWKLSLPEVLIYRWQALVSQSPK